MLVRRSLLRKDEYPDRLRAEYALEIRNILRDKTVTVTVFDQLPFFLRPLWYSGGRQMSNLKAKESSKRSGIEINPTDHWTQPTRFRIEVELSPGEKWQMTVPVLKSHIHMKSYSYACEKGFDIEAAMYEVRIGEMRIHRG